MPPPPQIEAERLAYEKALKEQLEKQSAAVMEEAKVKQAMLKQAAETQKQQMILQIDEKCALDCMKVEHDALNMVNGLKEAAITQQTMQEERCAVAVAEFNKKRAMEEMSAQSWSLQQKWYQNEQKMMADYNQVMQAANAQGREGNPLMQGKLSKSVPSLPIPQSPLLSSAPPLLVPQSPKLPSVALQNPSVALPTVATPAVL